MATWSDLGGRSRRCVAAATGEAAPTDPGDGVHLYRVAAVTPVIRAPAGQTFTGTGSFAGYVYVEGLGLWIRAPRADDDLADFAGLERLALPTLAVRAEGGLRFMLLPIAVGLSGGAQVTVDYACVNRAGEAI